jgi:hypothetical protein
VANPYWNAPPQPLLDPNGKYLPYSTFPAGIGSGANSFEFPYVATLILNYKRDRFTITPSFQLEAGNRYGAPETTPGIDPAAGCGALAGSTVGDPRYPYGTAGGAPYEARACSTLFPIPTRANSMRSARSASPRSCWRICDSRIKRPRTWRSSRPSRISSTVASAANKRRLPTTTRRKCAATDRSKITWPRSATRIIPKTTFRRSCVTRTSRASDRTTTAAVRSSNRSPRTSAYG